VFFIVTWNFSLAEKEFDVKIPTAAHAKDAAAYAGQVIVNVKSDGTLVFNHETIAPDQLVAKLRELAKLYPDQAVILRGDENANYKFIANALDICSQANIYNIAFATAHTQN
jgi:biopolymer transport protein ExbD